MANIYRADMQTFRTEYWVGCFWNSWRVDMRIIAVIIQQKSIMALTCYSITVATYISQYLVSVMVQVFV